MPAFKSDFLRVMSERGFIHQISDETGLDELFAKETVTAYVGYDATATSLHTGNLISATMLYWMQETGHRPIALMGGGTSMIGDPSFSDEQRKLLTPEAIATNIEGIKRIFGRILRFGDGPQRRHHGQQCRLADEAQLCRVPARCRPAFLGQPHARPSTA